MIDKPAHVFDRDAEWRAVARFVARAPRQSQLGVVSGRRRQGKTFLLDAVATTCGAFFFGATEATEAEALRLFGSALQGHLNLAVPPRFDGWDEAITFLFQLTPAPIIILDEFPYLCRVAPALPSIIQRELDRRAGRPGPSILLCGSAMSVMGRLLAGNAPLRGRASLELVLHPFDHRQAADYWGLRDPTLALLTHSIVGGTPAYRRFVGGVAPRRLAGWDDWVVENVLDPSSPLLREARYLLDEEMDLRDTALYHSVLGAVAAGNATRGGIAAYIGRKAADIGHHLNVLEGSGLLHREQDLLRRGRSTYRIAEPLITFYHAVMRPQWALLENGRGAAVWRNARPTFLARVVGPHFERVCRDFAVMAGPEVFGGLPAEVGRAVVPDPGRRGQIEVDVVVLAPPEPGQARQVLSLGEAKWGDAVEDRHIARLIRARDLLAIRGYDTRATVLAGYSGRGFARGLQARFAAERLFLADPARLYEGDASGGG